MFWITEWIKKWLKTSQLEKVLSYKKGSEDAKMRILEIQKIKAELEREEVQLRVEMVALEKKAHKELDNLFISSEVSIDNTPELETEVVDAVYENKEIETWEYEKNHIWNIQSQEVLENIQEPEWETLDIKIPDILNKNEKQKENKTSFFRTRKRGKFEERNNNLNITEESIEIRDKTPEEKKQVLQSFMYDE
jgi:hypothetical protein